MAFAALAARRAIATSSRIADIPRPSMAVHTRQLFGAVRVLSPSGSSHRREAALGLGAKRFLSSPGEGEFEDAVARSKSLSNPVRYLGPESPKNLPIVRRILPLGAAIFLSMPSNLFQDLFITNLVLGRAQGNDTLLSLYALFKQANHGPCDTSKPGTDDRFAIDDLDFPINIAC